MTDRPYRIYRYSSIIGRVLYDTQCTQEGAESSVLTGQTEHPGERFEIAALSDVTKRAAQR
jgi:sulfate adenylyltransferase subunit 1 (EFTu-like GTPase family)